MQRLRPLVAAAAVRGERRDVEAVLVRADEVRVVLLVCRFVVSEFAELVLGEDGFCILEAFLGDRAGHDVDLRGEVAARIGVVCAEDGAHDAHALQREGRGGIAVIAADVPVLGFFKIVDVRSIRGDSLLRDKAEIFDRGDRAILENQLLQMVAVVRLLVS